MAHITQCVSPLKTVAHPPRRLVSHNEFQRSPVGAQPDRYKEVANTNEATVTLKQQTATDHGLGYTINRH
jgi:hypothetical protein